MSQSSDSGGPLAVVFMWVGLIAGGSAGLEVGGGWGLVMGAIVLGIVGYTIGCIAEAVIAWLFFVTVAVISLLINAAIRQVVWQAVLAVLGSSGGEAPTGQTNAMIDMAAPAAWTAVESLPVPQHWV